MTRSQAQLSINEALELMGKAVALIASVSIAVANSLEETPTVAPIVAPIVTPTEEAPTEEAPTVTPTPTNEDIEMDIFNEFPEYAHMFRGGQVEEPTPTVAPIVAPTEEAPIVAPTEEAPIVEEIAEVEQRAVEHLSIVASRAINGEVLEPKVIVDTYQAIGILEIADYELGDFRKYFAEYVDALKDSDINLEDNKPTENIEEETITLLPIATKTEEVITPPVVDTPVTEKTEDTNLVKFEYNPNGKKTAKWKALRALDLLQPTLEGKKLEMFIAEFDGKNISRIPTKGLTLILDKYAPLDENKTELPKTEFKDENIDSIPTFTIEQMVAIIKVSAEMKGVKPTDILDSIMTQETTVTQAYTGMRVTDIEYISDNWSKELEDAVTSLQTEEPTVSSDVDKVILALHKKGILGHRDLETTVEHVIAQPKRLLASFTLRHVSEAMLDKVIKEKPLLAKKYLK